ncbi:MAG TPA: hypothetical protein VN258_05365 [Mobilitalea sp.]|nr:hypothetical protein [Mobilitalea sp.]
MNKLINLMCEYLESIKQPISWMDYTVNYILPIVGTLLLVGTAIAGVIKYYKEKDRDFNEKILNGVYAPLYQYIIKQEYVRSKKADELPINKYPIIEIVHEKTITTDMLTQNQKTITEKRKFLSRDELLKVTKELNFGLVPNDLLVLLNIYEIANEIPNNVDGDEYTKIEMKIRSNIINGYQKYKKLLNIDDNKSKIVKFEDNEIKFNI